MMSRKRKGEEHRYKLTGALHRRERVWKYVKERELIVDRTPFMEVLRMNENACCKS